MSKLNLNHVYKLTTPEWIMNYLQLQSNRKFAPEEALLADYFGDGNYVPFHAKQVQQRRFPLKRGDFLAGGLHVTLHALRQLGVTYSHNDYPRELSMYLHRNVWLSTLKRIRLQIESEGDIPSVFIKPSNKLKRFTGCVVSTMDDIAPLASIGNIFIHCSDAVQWCVEYRVPVINGKIQGYFWYYGDKSVMVDTSVVEQMVKNFASAPSAYCLDIGVLGTGETALVEMNDAFSIGMYDGMESCYPELLITRWKELTMR